MNTQEYLQLLREKTGFNDYKIAKEFNINQSNLSKYSRGTATLSETHAFLFASVLNINPAQIIANTRLEKAINNNNQQQIQLWKGYVVKYQASSLVDICIALGQINPILGDLKANTDKIIAYTNKAKTMGATMVIFPELVVTGYPPEDLLLRSNFIEQTIDTTNNIIKNMPDDIYIVFGSIDQVDQSIYNTAFVGFNQSIIGIYHKQILPNYGVFDEKRYFATGTTPLVIDINEQKVGIVICEDIWCDSIIKQNISAGAQTIISLNSSPFHKDKQQQRQLYLMQKSKQYKTPMVYVNCVGGQDELVFDGGSFMTDALGNISHEAEVFVENISLNKDKKILKNNNLCQKVIYDSLVLGTKDYIKKNGFHGAVLGLSGGIDSALTLAIAVDAIGASNVQVMMMPSPYTANISLLDAQSQANTMGVIYENITITPIMDIFTQALKPLFSGLATDTTEENIQARIRGTLLMALSNKTGNILLTTGNKSEYAVGYSTLYGDMNGGFAPLKDVYKSMVYTLANYRNSISPVIPERVLTRPPSAELSLNQLDQDTLPAYEILDDILELFIEKRYSVEQIIASGHQPDVVNKIVAMVLKNEHKRRQSAPGIKISENAFGKERRYPITSKFVP